ncbi:MAG: MBL fold metallo-hydrolase [Rhodobacteraceae bacterium]|nr:MBL fold metallo-hydrolase [Paracoccaceae bacterium]
MKIRYPVSGVPIGAEAEEIVDGLLWFRLPLPMALDHVNIFALRDDDGWTLVDTGMRTGKARALWSQILAGPLAGAPVRRVILTHHHPDHVGFAGWFRRECGAEILATRIAWLTARMLTLDEQAHPTPEAIEFYRGTGVPDASLAEYEQKRPFNFSDCVHPIPNGFKRIRDGDKVKIGGRIWKVRIGHGHAPSHATFWCEDAPLVLGGDQFLPEITPNIGVYPTEPEADPLRGFLKSCKKFMRFTRPDHLVLPGHKQPYTGLKLRLKQLLDNHDQALARLRSLLANPVTTFDTLNAVFQRPIRSSEFSMALAEAQAHLNFLVERGEASRELNGKGVWIWRRR